MTTRRRRSPEQIVRLLGQSDQLLAYGEDLGSVCRTLSFSESSSHSWCARFSGMNIDDAKCLKELETENATLKRLLADAELEKAALNEIAEGKKMVSPRAKRAALHRLITTLGLSEREAFQVVELLRSPFPSGPNTGGSGCGPANVTV